MVVSLTVLDRIALVLYAAYVGGAIGGAWLLFRHSDRRRIWGWIILVESVAAIILLTMMSTDYWISNTRSGVFNLGIRSILFTLAYIFPPIGLGAILALTVGFLMFKMMRRERPLLNILISGTVIPVFFLVSGIQLFSLSEQSRPLLPDPERDVSITPGFRITAFITEPASNPTSIIFSADGNMYIANQNGDIWFISMKDKSTRRFASGFVLPVGLAWHENSLFVASRGKITTLRDTDGDHVADKTSDIVDGLPAGIFPWHGNNGLVFGGDGRLYFPVGSTSDAAPVTYQYEASILSVEEDGSDLRTYAIGVRNPYRLAFNQAGDLFATDNAPGLLDVAPPDELNHIIEGGDYGFPRDFGLPAPSSNTIGPIALFPQHASANGIVFYGGDQFPSEYYDNAFVALWSIGQIYRVQVTKGSNGEYLALTSIFINGLQNPLDIANGPDGSLYLVDYGDSVVYKISYTGNP